MTELTIKRDSMIEIPFPFDGSFVKHTKIINTYHQKVIHAYNELLCELLDLFFGQLPKELPDNPAPDAIDVKLVEESDHCKLTLTGISIKQGKSAYADLHQEFCRITGRCGARCGAAKKAAQGDIIVAELSERAERYNLDMTITVALHASKQILRTRSLSKNKLARFGKPGRTRSNMSDLIGNPEPLAPHIAELQSEMEAFSEHCTKARKFYTQQWIKVWKKQKAAFTK